ncbi:MAG: tRNA (adenosine(37)-N6)-threonylcarbamoyltransferase complex dimerization subunit type 1 TsaB [Chloroflexota bacterium]|nr:tRNA (adenosine(37)-N6)-threonylcarbamoyltransferase complex dimerization subunit type 1 TsaB [Chloroflexota bacterium]
MVLAIDTATRYAGLALYDGRSVLAEFTWRSELRHTITLTPNLIRMLNQQELTTAQLEGLAVALGPGSFTGLRIGLAVAKGLALARDLPLVGVPTLDIVAYACAPLLPAQSPLPLRALLEAGRGRFCVADYRWTGGRFQREGDYRILERDEVGVEVREPTLFCGELDSEVEQALRARLGDRAVVAPSAARLRRPGYLAQLGWERLVQGERDDPASLSPIYH